jgi:hypothetical protein
VGGLTLLSLNGRVGAERDLVVDCERIAVAPRLDGDLSDWSQAVWIPFGPEAGTAAWQRAWLLADLAEPPGSAQTDDDLSGAVALRWDEEFVYLAARVTDNVHDTDSPQSQAWYQRDGIALFFDTPRDGDGSGWVSGDHALHFTADRDPEPHGRWWRRGTPEGHRESPAPTGVSHGVRLTARGYDLEARIPLELLRAHSPGLAPPLTEREVGFLFLVSDPDGGERGFGGQLMWGGTSDDDSAWSALRFVDTGRAAPPRLRPDPAWERFRRRLNDDLDAVGPLFVAPATTARQDSQQVQLGDDYFEQYLRQRPSRLATKALWMASTLWGNAGAVDRFDAALLHVADDEDVWEELVPGLRQAALRGDRFHRMLDTLEDAATRVQPLKSRSVLLFTLAEYWVGVGRFDRARPVLQDVVRWRASPWHARRAWELLREIDGRLPAPLPDLRG